MKFRFTLAGVLLLSFGLTNADAFDWKALHERADSLSLEQAKQGVREAPHSAENQYLLGLVALTFYHDTEAREAFEAALRLDPRIQEPRWGIAEVLRRQHRLEESEKILRELVTVLPSFSPSYITLAYLYFMRAKFTETVRWASKVLDQGKGAVDVSNYTRALFITAGARGMLAYFGGPLAKMINGTAVLPLLKDAERLQPGSAGVSFGFGSFYLLAPRIIGGDTDKAIAYLERAISQDPLFVDAYVRLAQGYKRKGNLEKYASLLSRALELDPQSEFALDVKKGTCRFICVEGP